MDVIEDCLPLNEHVMCIFLSNGLTINEYIVLLAQQIREALQVHALAPHARGEELLDLPVGSKHVECREV